MRAERPTTADSPARRVLAELIEQACELRKRIDTLSAPNSRVDELLAEEAEATREVDRLRGEIEAASAEWVCGGAARPADRSAELAGALTRLSAANAAAAAARRLSNERNTTEQALQSDLAEINRRISEARLSVVREEFEVLAVASATARAAAAAADARLFGLVRATFAVSKLHHDRDEEDAGRTWALAGEDLATRANEQAPAAPLDETVEVAASAAAAFLRALQTDATAEVGTNA